MCENPNLEGILTYKLGIRLKGEDGNEVFMTGPEFKEFMKDKNISSIGGKKV
jgi:hypothetical protein